MTAVPVEQTGRYACPACPLRFESLADKKAHVRKEHPKTQKLVDAWKAAHPAIETWEI